MHPYVSQSSQVIRAYYGGIGKTAVIFPAAFLVAVAMGQLTLGMVLYARAAFVASPTQIGVLAGIWSVTYVAACLLIRPLFSRVLPRYLVIGSTGAMAVLTFAMAQVGTLNALFILYALFGMVLSFFWPTMMGWVSTTSEGVQLGRIISRFNFAWCSGNMISPFVCGWLSERDPRYPLLFAAGLLILVMAFVSGASMVLPKVKADRGSGAAHDAAPGERDNSCILRYPAWIGLFAAFFAMGIVIAVFPLAALQEWSLQETVIGAILTGRGLTNMFGFIVLGKFHGWHFRQGPMLAAQWTAVVVFAGLALSGSVWIAALLLAGLGLSNAMSYSASLFHGAAGSLNRTRRMAIHESILAAGLVCGSIAGGWLYELLGYEWLFAIVAMLLAGLTVVQTLVGRTLVSKVKA